MLIFAILIVDEMITRSKEEVWSKSDLIIKGKVNKKYSQDAYLVLAKLFTISRYLIPEVELNLKSVKMV